VRDDASHGETEGLLALAPIRIGTQVGEGLLDRVALHFAEGEDVTVGDLGRAEGGRLAGDGLLLPGFDFALPFEFEDDQTVEAFFAVVIAGESPVEGDAGGFQERVDLVLHDFDGGFAGGGVEIEEDADGGLGALAEG